MNQRFDPIDHVNWNAKGKNVQGITPSPSQIRDSIVMFNPVGLSTNKTFVSKGTAKEQVRNLNKQLDSSGNPIPTSPSLNGPLYGFYDYVPERPHGAENLIPKFQKSGSEMDLRKQMDNANV